MHKAEIEISKKNFNIYGKKLKLFPGVNDWFKRINKFGKNTTISVRGRHDPCVGIRAVPVGEAMMNCVLLDHYLMHKAQCS